MIMTTEMSHNSFVAGFRREVFKPYSCIHLSSLTFHGSSCIISFSVAFEPHDHLPSRTSPSPLLSPLKKLFSVWLVLSSLPGPLNVATTALEAKYHPFIDPFNKDILNTHSVPDSVLGAVDTAMDKTSWNYLLSWGFCAKGGGR